MALVEIDSNGLAKGVAVELLSTPNLGADNTSITLADDITKYDTIEVITAYYEQSQGTGYTHFQTHYFDKDSIAYSLANANNGIVGFLNAYGYANKDYGKGYVLRVTSSTTILINQKATVGWSASQCYIYKIIGYR